MKTGSGFLTFALAATALAAAESRPDARDAFNRVKALAGEWEGTVSSPDGPQGRVVFQVTSHGTAVLEIRFPGTSHEMVTLYHIDGDDLVATHYCALGNQPRARLERADAQELQFAFAGGANLKPETDAHIHSGAFRILNADRFEAEWTVYEGGRPVGANRFFMTRRKP